MKRTRRAGESETEDLVLSAFIFTRNIPTTRELSLTNSLSGQVRIFLIKIFLSGWSNLAVICSRSVAADDDVTALQSPLPGRAQVAF